MICLPSAVCKAKAAKVKGDAHGAICFIFWDVIDANQIFDLRWYGQSLWQSVIVGICLISRKFRQEKLF